MNTQALQRITNPEPATGHISGSRILMTRRRAETTARLKAELEQAKRDAAQDAQVKGWMDLIAGRQV